MRANDVVIFIDSQGVSHNALVKSFREPRGQNNILTDEEPLISLTYYDEATGAPREMLDVPHIGHPARQEKNADLPSYALHAWKFLNEEHLEVPPDHPLRDRPYSQAETDADGKVIPKRRPIYEEHIRRHLEGKQAAHHPGGNAAPPPVTASVASTSIASTTSVLVPVSLPVRSDASVGHPAHPETVQFAWTCESCGASVQRIASHQGGKLWEAEASAADHGSASHPSWTQHICKQEDIEAYRVGLKTSPRLKSEPEMSDLQKVALEPAGDPPKPPSAQAEIPRQDIDVAKQLDQAGPPPPME
ncbi:MAG TPA: hypothetical protein VKZ53_18585 [Candidatus Angelobacter sp.]|nr:hypothetical protein [Candidatus Angelobacter sp.]